MTVAGSGMDVFIILAGTEWPLRVDIHTAYLTRFTRGLSPLGLKVLHSCHIRHCVNPNHLRLGTTQDNSDDMVNAGRSLVGFKNGRAKLSEDSIQIILKLREYTSPYEIADIFGVNYTTIRNTVRRYSN